MAVVKTALCNKYNECEKYRGSNSIASNEQQKPM
jgi:hypothetical protein